MDEGKLKEWALKPLWRHNELAILCCGISPDEPLGDRYEEVNSASEIIKRAGMAGDLTYEKFSAESSDLNSRYYDPAEAVKWATKQYPETFPDFTKFIDNRKKKGRKSEELSEGELNSLLKMVLGMAISKYEYDIKPGRNLASGDSRGSITVDITSRGLALDKATVHKYLQMAVDRFGDVVIENDKKVS